MSENKKEIHIVFQVLNFIFGSECAEYPLLPLHKLLLIALAKHHGPKGIYPAVNTLKKELNTTDRYIRILLNNLELWELIKIERFSGKSSHYYLSFLSTSPELQFRGELQFSGEPQFLTPLNHSSGHPGTPVQPINTNNQYKRNNTERARKKTRTSLPDYFLPNEKITALLKEVSLKANKTTDQLLTKFKNLQKSKDGMSADWNAEFENFLINERPMGYTGNGSTELKSTVPFYGQPGHPSYEEDKKLKDKLAEQEIKRAKPKFEVVNNEPIVYESFRDAKRRYELSQQGALNNVSQSGNNSGGSDSS